MVRPKHYTGVSFGDRQEFVIGWMCGRAALSKPYVVCFASVIPREIVDWYDGLPGPMSDTVESPECEIASCMWGIHGGQRVKREEPNRANNEKRKRPPPFFLGG